MRRPRPAWIGIVGAVSVVLVGIIVVRNLDTPRVAPPSSPERPTSPSAVECDVSVESGGDIQAASDAAGAGATICLSGTYELDAPIHPYDGQSFVGPATITGSTHTGFELKGTESHVDVTSVDVSLVDLDISGFSLRAVECWLGMTIMGGRLHDNGRNGLGCGLEHGPGHILIDGVEIDGNGGTDHLGSGSGGIKIAQLGPDGLTVRDSSIHDNLGNGVWCDVQCIGTFLIEGNEIAANSRKGVHYEKSGASDEYIAGQVVEGQAIVRDNVVTGNGTEGRAHAADGGIVGVSSRNMLIENNTTSGNHRAGVILRTDGRLTGDKHGWPTEAVVRGDGMSDGILGCEEPGVTCE
jgi:hypothetical protein